MEFKTSLETYTKYVSGNTAQVKEWTKTVCDAIVENVQQQMKQRCEISASCFSPSSFAITFDGELATISAKFQVKRCVLDILKRVYGLVWEDNGYAREVQRNGVVISTSFNIYVPSVMNYM